MSEQDVPDAKAKSIAMVSNIIRGTGAVFMILAAIIGLDLGGISEALHFGSAAKIVGGVLFVVGCLDFLVLPQVLAKLMGTTRNRAE